jgi:hypothetical protein
MISTAWDVDTKFFPLIILPSLPYEAQLDIGDLISLEVVSILFYYGENITSW